MDRCFEVLKDTIESETLWCIESINEKNPEDEQIPLDISLRDFVGQFNHIDPYDRGMLFAYLSCRDKVEVLSKF